MMFRIVFWDVLRCKMIVDRRFGGTYCLHHQGWWNVGRQSFYTAVHPRRQFWISLCTFCLFLLVHYTRRWEPSVLRLLRWSVEVDHFLALKELTATVTCHACKPPSVQYSSFVFKRSQVKISARRPAILTGIFLVFRTAFIKLGHGQFFRCSLL
jgi:hypothetical protein